MDATQQANGRSAAAVAAARLSGATLALVIGAVLTVVTGPVTARGAQAAQDVHDVEVATATPVKAVAVTRLQAHEFASRPCQPFDLLGLWTLVSYEVAGQPRHAQAPHLLPYQAFQFAPDGTVKSMQSRQAFAGDRQALFDAIPAALRYDMVHEARGTVVVRASDAATPAETWSCRRMTIDHVDLLHHRILQQGDLVLTLIGKSGAPLFTRQLRRS